MCSRFNVQPNLWLALSLFSFGILSCQSPSQEDKAVNKPVIPMDTITSLDTVEKPLEEEKEVPLIKPVDTVKEVVSVQEPLRRDTLKLYTDSLSPRYIYLTFDDGPLIGSQAIDSITTAKQIKTNVFLIGKHTEMSKRLFKFYQNYLNNPLVESYNHSYSHADNKFNVFYSNPTRAYEDFAKNELSLNLKHKIVRLPGRNIWYFDARRRVDLESGASTADLLYANGYKIMGWDVEWKINGSSGRAVESVSQIYRSLRNRLNNGSTFSKNNAVLLMHDDMFQTKKGQKLLSDLIDSLKQHPNYKFEHLRSYPKG